MHGNAHRVLTLPMPTPYYSYDEKKLTLSTYHAHLKCQLLPLMPHEYQLLPLTGMPNDLPVCLMSINFYQLCLTSLILTTYT